MHPADSTALYAAQVLWGLVVMGAALVAAAAVVDVAYRVRAWLHRGEL